VNGLTICVGATSQIVDTPLAVVRIFVRKNYLYYVRSSFREEHVTNRQEVTQLSSVVSLYTNGFIIKWMDYLVS
jgi:hypothetical protein